MNFVKFLRTPFLQNTSGQPLLNTQTINNECYRHIGPIQRICFAHQLTGFYMSGNFLPIKPTYQKSKKY